MSVEEKFYDEVEDALLKFAVIIAKSSGKFIYCKHKDRNTWEVPGGHRESGEKILDTARRELYEETGAIDFTIKSVCAYSVIDPGSFNGQKTYGMLYFADVKVLESELHSEIEKVMLMNGFPDHWTYPLIQPKLMEEAKHRGFMI